MSVPDEIVAARRDARVLILGVGGLGAPAAIALAHAGVGTLVLVDDDAVDRSNLHRQIVYRDADVGRPKLDAARDALLRACPNVDIELRPGRLRPDRIDLLEGVDLIVECTDRYNVKFLAADAAHLAGVPIVHGAAIRWVGTALSVGPEGGPCYRCLFEEIPPGAQQGCDVAGVVGPVCGIVGAIQAHFALAIVDRAETQPAHAVYGRLASVDGRDAEPLRIRSVARRIDCALCGIDRGARIDRIDASRYATPIDDCPVEEPAPKPVSAARSTLTFPSGNVA